MKFIICLDVLWLFQQLIDHRVIRINFEWNSYDKDKLGSKDKIYYICSLYIILDIKESHLPVFLYSLEGNNVSV
jgi:hypothetical protein